MKEKIAMALLASAVALGSVGGTLPASAQQSVRAPLRTWYEAPAVDWESQATPIGNGFIGGMIFGGVESDHIQLNEHTVWSGGPGSSASYDFGVSTKSADAKAAINTLRQKLQDIYTDFTKNHAAHLDKDGNIVASDYSYGDMAAEVAALERPLYGDRSSFGFYQSLGDLYLTDPAASVPLLDNATSTAEPAGGEGETASQLFDRNAATKWFAGNAGKPLTFPVTVSWNYTAPYKLSSYEMTSGNDMEGRDPSAWTLSGSVDGVSYEVIDTQSNVTFNSRGATNVYPLGKTVSYRFFKMEITATRESLPPQLADITFPEVKTDTSYTDYTRSLDLRTAVASLSYQQSGVTFTRDYFASNPDQVMVIRLTADKAGSLSRTISVSSEQTKKTVTAAGDTITMVGQPADQRADGLQFAQQIKVIPKGGTMRVAGNAICVEDADEILLLLAAATNYVQVTDGSKNYFSDTPPLDTVKARLAAASAKSYTALREAHEADYTELFARVELQLGSMTMPTVSTAKLMEAYKAGTLTEDESRYLEVLYYQFGRYLLIASSRDGSVPANLQGIWATGLNPPWNCDYHTNINVQMNYWPAQQTNLAECQLPLIDYIRSLVKTGERYANYYYARPDGGDVRGWACACGCNIWNHIGSNDSEIGFVPSGAAWLAESVWEYYQYTLDRDFLTENYDILLGAALFWVDNLWTDTRDGTLVVNPSFSPENGILSLGTAYDQSIVWEIFNTVLEASDVLGYDTTEVGEIRTALGKLSSPLKIGSVGQFMEWKDETLADIHGSGQHRHVSQLYGLHPGTMVVAGRSEQDDAYIESMKQTLRLRGDGGTGWSKAWKINFWARLRDGDHAGLMLKEILKESTMQNLFDTHPPFQIDGNFGATAGMTEMLLQSQGDSIDLFAAVPNAWGVGGSVSGIMARGNFEVSMSWANQQLSDAAVLSNAGAACTLNYHRLSEATITKKSDGSAVAFTKVDSDTVTFPTEKGETYVISEIPQDKKFSQQTNLLRTTFNNLYTEKMVEDTGCPDTDGAYVESFDVQPTGKKIGIEVGDVVRAFNGEVVKTSEDLLAKYTAVKAGDPITFTVWRGEGTFDTTFTKMDLTENQSDLYHVMPGTVYTGGYQALYEGMTAVTANGGTCVKGPGSGLYYNLQFNRAASSAKMLASATGDGQVRLYIDSNGDEDSCIAQFAVSDTNGTFKEFTGGVSNAALMESSHDVYIEIKGDVTVQWFTLGTDAMLGDVDGDSKITTTDARLTLQFAAEKITADKLNTAVADVDHDTKVTTTDARKILQRAADKITSFD